MSHLGYKKVTYTLSFILCSAFYPVYAVQPLNDNGLANTIGEQSPISLSTNTDTTQSAKSTETQESSNSASFDFEQHPDIQNLVNQYTQYQINTPLIKALSNQSTHLQQQYNFSIQNLHLTAERNLGLEPFSMTWHGNLDEIIDVSNISFVTFNTTTGQYELNNVQGRVWIEATVD